MLLKKSEDRLLFLLKNKGAQTSKALATELEMTAMGARQHLLSLEEKGLVSTYSEKSGVGRPKQFWRLTEQAANRFPDMHAYLTVELINNIESTFGKRGLQKLIKEREKKTQADYKKALDHYIQLNAKIRKLAEIRTQEGYMADYQRCDDGSYLLFENHCPICAAATKCQQFCQSELELFQSLFNNMNITVTRESHIISGARRCAYQFSKSKKTASL